MVSIGQFRHAAAQGAGAFLSEIRSARAPRPYYQSQPSCQIPNLAHLFSLFLGERETGTFVEVGAYDGVFVSNTWGLAERGWTGYMAEPVPDLAARCRANHRSHPHVSVTETAIGDGSVSELRLYVAGTLTTASSAQNDEYREVDWAAASLTDKQIVVPSQTLDSFLSQVGAPEGFDVLVVDVEGFERQVFAGFSIARWRPAMIIVELADTHRDLQTSRNSDAHLGLVIQDSGYRIVFKDEINTVLVRNSIWDATFPAIDEG